ncbi:MAG: hypothetical protein HYR74_09025 [Candidatus Eisenbacteria bacterium]|nr:hypothetical protein [Candidatus Eisenbacteria bacterium]
MTPPLRFLPALIALITFAVPPASGADTPDSAATPTTRPTAESPMRPNWFYYLKGDELVRVDATPLESRESVGAGDVAAGLLWGGGGKTWMTLPGATSEIHIAEAKPRFRMATERVAALMIRLAPFEVRKDKRWAQTDRGRQQAFFKKPVPLDVTKISDGLYEITPSKPLDPGEYGFALSAGGPVTDFTIVALKDKKSE